MGRTTLPIPSMLIPSIANVVVLNDIDPPASFAERTFHALSNDAGTERNEEWRRRAASASDKSRKSEATGSTPPHVRSAILHRRCGYV